MAHLALDTLYVPASFQYQRDVAPAQCRFHIRQMSLPYQAQETIDVLVKHTIVGAGDGEPTVHGSRREAIMFVAVEHTIQDPEVFWAKAGEIVPNLPASVKLHQCFPNKSGTRGICIWEGESVRAIQMYLDGQVGHVSSNDYFEVENKDSIALPTGIVPSAGTTKFSQDTMGRRPPETSAPPA